jgi:hypothetical protein
LNVSSMIFIWGSRAVAMQNLLGPRVIDSDPRRSRAQRDT